MKNTPISQQKWKIDEANELPLAVIEDTENGMGVAEIGKRTPENLARAKAIAALPQLIVALQTFPEEPEDLDSADPFDAWQAYRLAIQEWNYRVARTLTDAGVK